MLNEWIENISKPREELGGLSVCPYAKKSDYSLIETDGGNIAPPPWNFELIVYKLPEHYSVDELNSIASEYNTMYPEMVFLPDHKDRDTFINGVQTNNGKYNLILCQWRDNLESARTKLKNSNYYSFWDQEYLKEILSQ
jgi:hypothetical protein